MNIHLSQMQALHREIKNLRLEMIQKRERAELRPPHSEKLLTRMEVARAYKISLPTVSKQIKHGLPFIRVGRKYLFDADHTRQYFEKVSSRYRRGA